jgi:hypothetical protein
MPKAVKCLHTFEIQNTANVVAMDETAIYDYLHHLFIKSKVAIGIFAFSHILTKL